MTSEEAPHKPDIFRKQRELAREKYASSDEEEEEYDKNQPPRTPERPSKPPDDDDGVDENDQSRRDDKPGADRDGSGRDQAHGGPSESSAPSKAFQPTSSSKRQLEDQDTLQYSDAGQREDVEIDRFVDVADVPKAQFVGTAPLQTVSTMKRATRIVPTVPSPTTSETSSTWSSSRIPDVPFSFADPQTQVLAVELYIKVLLNKCLVAFNRHGTMTTPALQECTDLKHAARLAHGIAEISGNGVAETTIARCCFYIALTEVLYSVDSPRKSDARALKWFRRAFAYHNSTESDLAQLWIKELHAPAQAQHGQYSRPSTDNSAKSSGLMSSIFSSSPGLPLSASNKWLRKFGSTPTSSAGDDKRPQSAHAGSSRPSMLPPIRRLFSSSQLKTSNRDILLAAGPVGAREEPPAHSEIVNGREIPSAM